MRFLSTRLKLLYKPVSGLELFKKIYMCVCSLDNVMKFKLEYILYIQKLYRYISPILFLGLA